MVDHQCYTIQCTKLLGKNMKADPDVMDAESQFGGGHELRTSKIFFVNGSEYLEM